MKWTFFYRNITSLLILCNTLVFAKQNENNLSDPLVQSPGNWFISMGVGEQYPQWHNPMKVNNSSGFPAPYNKDLYATKNQNEAVIAFSVGRHWQLGDFWFPSYSFGVFWQYFFRTHLGKTITLYSNPELTNYRYNWNLTANLLLASAKLNLLEYKKFSPYVNVGIGSSFNRTSNYKEKALTDVTPRFSPQFSKFSTSEFSYVIGIGVDLQFMSQLILSVGYNYQNLGQISSGPGKEIWSNQSLNPGSYHSNEVLLSVSYFLGK
ncbi:outer membrane protein [Legionella sp.]|uniref:outer membrane protein n=1 Tax=Legionella sp. TaxID=459 RepID=UPI003C979D31